MEEGDNSVPSKNKNLHFINAFNDGTQSLVQQHHGLHTHLMNKHF